MRLYPAIWYVIAGICLVEALVWCVVLPWESYRYTTGITVDELWRPVLSLAAIGAVLGLGVLAAKSALKRR